MLYSHRRWDESFGTSTENLERDFLSQIGYTSAGYQQQLSFQTDRLVYWNLAGSRPFAARGGFTPFGPVEDLELRMFNGQNHSRVLTRFERAVNTTAIDGQKPAEFPALE